MSVKFSTPYFSRTASVSINSARQHARISGRLLHSASSFRLPSDPLRTGWSPLRLDLLKAPLSRLRE